MNKNNTPIIISLGGSIVIPDDIDTAFILKFKSFIEEQIGKGRRFIVVVGGGKTCRKYQGALKEVLPETSREELDWLGIHSTRFNAEFVRAILKENAHTSIYFDLDKEVEWTTPVLVVAGWKPGCSTDTDAVLIAQKFGAQKIVNLTNIERVYDKDPKEHSDAEPKDELSWSEYRSIIPSEWESGMNAPFDPIASKMAEESGLEVAIIKGQNIESLQNYIEGESFDGTRLH